MRDFDKLSAQLEQRGKDARTLEYSLDRLLTHVERQMPKYSGKTAFIDRMIKARNRARLLAFNLESERDYLDKEI